MSRLIILLILAMHLHHCEIVHALSLILLSSSKTDEINLCQLIMMESSSTVLLNTGFKQNLQVFLRYTDSLCPKERESVNQWLHLIYSCRNNLVVLYTTLTTLWLNHTRYSSFLIYITKLALIDINIVLLEISLFLSPIFIHNICLVPTISGFKLSFIAGDRRVNRTWNFFIFLVYYCFTQLIASVFNFGEYQ